jgi:hypothetical protein
MQKQVTSSKRQAKKEQGTTKPVKAEKKEEPKAAATHSKRVKFGAVNRSKSWNASMKALTTLKEVPLPSTTEAKSVSEPILREPKFTPPPKSKQGKKLAMASLAAAGGHNKQKNKNKKGKRS